MQHRMLGGGYTNMDNEYDQGYGMEPVIYTSACVCCVFVATAES